MPEEIIVQKEIMVQELRAAQENLERSSRCLEEGDSGFVPTEGVMTAAQQVAHIAQTIDWFLEGVFRPEGFDMNFEKHAEEIAGVTSLAAAREWVDRSFDAAVQAVESRTPEEMAEPIAEGPIMGGAPRFAFVGAVVDHTAHHRGALTIYSRILGKTPAMPYMEGF